MNNRSLKLPAIILAIGLVAALVACLLVSVVKAPTVTAQDFDYAVTYKLNGETKTVEGVYHVDFKFSEPQDRYYEGYYLSDPTSGEPKDLLLAEKDELKLRVVFIFSDDFLMGDAYAGETYSEAILDPYLAVYDQMGCEYVEEEYLGQFDAELVSWETPQPIENSFVFKGFYVWHNYTLTATLLVGLLVLVACMIFVKRDKTISYTMVDKLSVVLSCAVGIVALPFITIVAAFSELTAGDTDVIYRVLVFVPALTAFALAASVALRRKGFTKAGLLSQLTGPALFALCLVVDSIALQFS